MPPYSCPTAKRLSTAKWQHHIERSPLRESLLKTDTFTRRARILLLYFSGQGFVQLLNISVGFLLLRWMSVPDYAQYIVAFGFQSTLTLLADLGLAGTIVGLVGTRHDDSAVLGAYIRSGQHFRNIMLFALSPVAAAVFLYVSHIHHWSLVTSIVLFLSTIASIYFTGMVSYYSAPLLIHGRLGQYYRNQTVAALARIISCFALFASGNLAAWSASWTNTLSFALAGMLNLQSARPYVALPAKPKPEFTKQMFNYILPSLPSLVFYSLQGQISIFLISLFGYTRNIAEVGALGRLGQAFLLLGSFNNVVLEPYVAKLPKSKVARIYISTLLLASGMCAGICLMTFIKPEVVLLLLGSKYQSLQRETGWFVLGSSLAYLVGVNWAVATARRWIYWSTSGLSIGLILLAQVVFLFLYRVNDTLHVILFGVVTSGAHLLAVLINGIYGYVRGPRIEVTESEFQSSAVLSVGSEPDPTTE